MMYRAVSSKSPVSTNAEKFSNLPCPYGCRSSAGWADTRTARNVMIAAIKSNPECKASDNTPRLPVRSTRKAFSDTNTSAEPTLSSAARFFSRCSPSGCVAITSPRLPQLWAIPPQSAASISGCANWCWLKRPPRRQHLGGHSAGRGEPLRLSISYDSSPAEEVHRTTSGPRNHIFAKKGGSSSFQNGLAGPRRRVALFSGGSSSLRQESQRGGVHAIPQARRLRSVGENMPEVRVAQLTLYFAPHDPESGVRLLVHILRRDRLPETRPPGTRIEFRRRVKKRVIAVNTSVESRSVLVMERAAKGPFRRGAARHVVLQRAKLFLPLLFGLPDLRNGRRTQPRAVVCELHNRHRSGIGARGLVFCKRCKADALHAHQLTIGCQGGRAKDESAPRQIVHVRRPHEWRHLRPAFRSHALCYRPHRIGV